MRKGLKFLLLLFCLSMFIFALATVAAASSRDGTSGHFMLIMAHTPPATIPATTGSPPPTSVGTTFLINTTSEKGFLMSPATDIGPPNMQILAAFGSGSIGQTAPTKDMQSAAAQEKGAYTSSTEPAAALRSTRNMANASTIDPSGVAALLATDYIASNSNMHIGTITANGWEPPRLWRTLASQSAASSGWGVTC